MTELLEIVSRLEGVGGTLKLQGDRICYSIPGGNDEARDLLAKLRKRKSEVGDLLRSRAIVGAMPNGVRLVAWNLKAPPVAIEMYAIVTDTALFAQTTLEQLRRALTGAKRSVGWTVPQLIDRLAQVGVSVALESVAIPNP